MPLTIPVGFGQAAIVLTSGPGTAPYVTTLGLNLLTAVGEDLVDVCNGTMQAFVDNFGSQVSNEVYIDHVTIQVGLSGGTSGSVQSDLPVVQGGNSGAMAPLAMSIIARKITGELGRKGKGRCFLPCMLNTGDTNEAGNLVPDTLSSYQARWTEFLVDVSTPAVGIGALPVVLHADGSTPSPITSGSVAPKVGWIRKRIR